MLQVNVLEILKQALDFTDNIVSKFDDEKYARAVMTIYGHEPDYKELDILAETIRSATDISTKEKSELLLAVADKRNALREKEIEYKQKCAKTINKGFEKKCKIAKKIALGLLTGGLSLLPDGYHAIENMFRNKLAIES